MLSSIDFEQLREAFFKFTSKSQNVEVLVLLIVTFLEYYLINHVYETSHSIKKQMKKICQKKKKVTFKTESKKHAKKKNNINSDEITDKKNLIVCDGVNSYAILKFYGMILMIIDHLGWCYIISDPILNNYTRAIGRGSAPIFFFLMGLSGSYKFRWVTWRWAAYIFVSEAIYSLHLVESTWESMSTFLFGNLVLKYAAPYLLKYKFLTGIVWILCYYGNEFINETMRIPYGGFAFQLMICGCYIASDEKLIGNCMIVATMGWKMYNTFFVDSDLHAAPYYIYVATFFLIINTLIFTNFKLVYNLIPKKLKLLENLIDLATKNAYLIYHGHMIYFYVVVRSWYIAGYGG